MNKTTTNYNFSKPKEDELRLEGYQTRMSSLILDLKRVTARRDSGPDDQGDTKRDIGTSDCPPGVEPIDISQIYVLPNTI